MRGSRKPKDGGGECSVEVQNDGWTLDRSGLM